MPMQPNSFIELFCEAFLSRTLWQFTSEIRYFAMMEFGGYDMLLPTIIAIAGGTCAGYANGLLGRMLAHCQEKGLFVLLADTYEKWQRRAEYLVWILGLLSWYWLASVLIFGAGFLRVRSWKVILSVFIGQLMFFGYYYIQTV